MTDTTSTDSGQAVEVSAAPKSFAALHHPGFRMFFLGNALAMMADSIEHVISYWIIFQKFHSPALGGFAIISHWLPFLLFSVYAGALADRFDPRRIIQLGMVLFIIASLGWGILFLTDSLQMWHAVVLLIIHGIAGVLWGPAAQMMIHDIVGREQLQSGVRLLAMARTLGILLGPAVGAGLMLWLGPTTGILINAAIYLPLTLWLWRAPYGPKFRAADSDAPKPAVRGYRDILDTIKDVTGNPVIVSMTLLAGAAAFIVGIAYQAQLPAFATYLGAERAGIQYSVLFTAGAAGAMTAGIVLESRGFLQAKPQTAFILVFLWALAMTGFAASTSFALSTALLFAAGFLHLAYGAMCQSLVQLHAPPHIRGRVIGLYSMSALGLMTFSGVTIGIGGAFIGINLSLGLSGALLIFVVTGLFFVMRRKGFTAAPAE